MNNGLSLIKIISGLSKTLNIAREVIPIYKQVKPIISNSGKLLSGLNNFSLNKQKNDNNNNNNTSTTELKQITNNNPVFFQ